VTAPDARRAVALWLLACALLVFAMVVVGGVTRLTRSGLSIVEWQPLLGAIPPLTEAAWLEEFAKYRRTPEYRLVNYGMDLAGFKAIYYVEWFHRLLGRLIGVAFLLPFAWFWWRRRLARPLATRLAVLFVLGAAQGALGWFMVKSGLVDVPRVSPYRLTAHLALALAIYGWLLWLALGLLAPAPVATAGAGIRRLARATLALIVVTMLAGGFVAGTHAGFSYNTFPLMGAGLVPPGLFAHEPWWVNLFENVATVQFNHRLLAYLTIAAVLALAWRLRNVAGLGVGPWLLVAALALQVTLGIATLLYVVPVPLAAAHQAGALVLYSVALWLAHRLRRPAGN
jgi:cytochrome c oxidase assembly protein subunit 15